MNEHEPVLKIRFDGVSIVPGKIPVAHLIKFLSNMSKAFQRTGRVLLGDAESVHRGRQKKHTGTRRSGRHWKRPCAISL